MGVVARTPQTERRAKTRARLLDAAIVCLAERGFAATTTVEVAERAGVSRGAQQHHFRTKSELLSAAIEHAFMQRLALFETAVADRRVTEDLDIIDLAVDIIWPMFQEPVAVAWIELTVAARTDPELQARVVSVSERMRATIDEQFRAMVEGGGRDELVSEAAAKLTFAAFEGLILQRMAAYDDAPGRATAAVAALKRMLQAALTSSPSPVRFTERRNRA
jgi:AcrR family transcriptional regulator